MIPSAARNCAGAGSIYNPHGRSFFAQALAPTLVAIGTISHRRSGPSFRIRLQSRYARVEQAVRRKFRVKNEADEAAFQALINSVGKGCGHIRVHVGLVVRSDREILASRWRRGGHREDRARNSHAPRNPAQRLDRRGGVFAYRAGAQDP
jgi:hypothetical protein